MRVATWNVNHRGPAAAARLGALAQELGVDLILLQAAHPDSLEDFRAAAGLDWLVSAWDAGAPALLSRERRSVAAVAGRGPRPVRIGYIQGLPRPERMMFADIGSGPGGFTVATYQAPTGADAGIGKVECAHLLLGWVRSVAGPLIVGADANTPKLDHPDPDRSRTHWHTGARKLQGRAGDDVMFGGRPKHQLEDAYRRFLSQNPGLLQAVAMERPRGPLAVSHIANQGIGGARKPCRYDAIWISRDFDVQDMQHELDGAQRAGSDHAIVTVDLAWDLA